MSIMCCQFTKHKLQCDDCFGQVSYEVIVNVTWYLRVEIIVSLVNVLPLIHRVFLYKTIVHHYCEPVYILKEMI